MKMNKKRSIQMKIGFIGLGIMGCPMAKHLVKAGFDVLVADLDAEKVAELVKEGATEATYQEMGEQCELVITILPTGTIVEGVLFGENGVASTMKKGIVVDHSSVTPEESRNCYEKLKAQGVGFLDAPVSGGEPGAQWPGAMSQGQGWRERGIQKRKRIIRLFVRAWPFLREIRCYTWRPASSTLSG